MMKWLFITSLTINGLTIFAQHDMLLFTKNNRTVSIFTQGSYIAIQLKSRQWIAGFIKAVRHDTFYLKPLEVVYSAFHIDTLASEIVRFTIADVYAFPKKGVQIDYKNGGFYITRSGGHVHWYWVKSGWIFRVLGAGYAGLVVTNGLIQKDFQFAGSKLGIAAAVFILGELLKLNYSPVLPLGKKYKVESVSIAR